MAIDRDTADVLATSILDGADRELGEAFHRQLFALMPTAAHADDAGHDLSVGKALRTAIAQRDPERAEREYNTWAAPAGYVPIRFLERRADGVLVVDIVEAVIGIDPEYHVTRVEPVTAGSAAGLRTRELPPAEWPRVAHTPLAPMLTHLEPSFCKILVVEDPAGEIVGTWAAMSLIHAEGVWIAPAYRKRTSVMRRLWLGMHQIVRGVGASKFLTGAADESIARLIERRDAIRLPPQYVLSIKEPRRCQ